MAFRKIYEEPNITYDCIADSMDLDVNTGTKTHMSRSKKTISGVQHLGLDSAGTRLYRLAAVCLGLLCVLLLTVIIVLSVKHTAARNQLQTSNNNLTKERDQLQTSNTNMTRERDQLQTSNTYLTTERDQLQTSNIYLTKERDQLQTSNTNLTKERGQLLNSNIYLTKERDQLQTSYTNLTKERNELQKRLSYCQHTCPQGWMMFSSSCYFITAELKIWSESRQDCRERGADLVIINSREEQEFLVSFGKEVWIGLTENGTVGTWNWLDGTELITGYWMSGEPNNLLEGCIKLNPYKLNPLKSWNDVVCHDNYYGFCEKSG